MSKKRDKRRAKTRQAHDRFARNLHRHWLAAGLPPTNAQIWLNKKVKNPVMVLTSLLGGLMAMGTSPRAMVRYLAKKVDESASRRAELKGAK